MKENDEKKKSEDMERGRWRARYEGEKSESLRRRNVRMRKLIYAEGKNEKE